MVQALLSGQTALELGKEHNISPGLINRWKRQYLNGQLGKNNNNKEIKKLQIQNSIIRKKVNIPKIQHIAYEHSYYSYRRITAQLHRENMTINHKRVLRMMRELGIQARIKRKYVTTTNSKHNNQVYPNLIKDFLTTGIN